MFAGEMIAFCWFSPTSCSGRIRQEGTGQALIELLVDGGTKCPELVNPYPTLKSWQWVGCSLDKVIGDNVTVMMTVRSTGQESSLEGVAYFDDLCLTFDIDESPGTKCNAICM